MRAEPRNTDTTQCPEENHNHSWRKPAPLQINGPDRVLNYSADAHGVVLLTEEALTELLRLAGFEPEEAR